MDYNNSPQSSGRSSGAAASGAAGNENTEAMADLKSDAKRAAQRTAATLRTELQTLKTDLDALMNRAPSLSDDELTEAHARLMTQFSSLRYAAKGIASEAQRQFNRSMENTSTYVNDKPWQSVSMAVAAGLFLGMLLKRR
ncbi:Membrane-anchored ribosome-binding protein, inhibits growth in stationary phase, ElaB/YqjD/DUF883 family [Noviherbaspirillum humi]|uniref:Membrane-anchored ribosome-binding protein, inhibits growth in stationary phase, ElaB/YqjD/DUF883 family n=1 Tax=Noviherbaspirillum humi TaxID=1688639 RepID=A0A239DT84_9BURK|nr:DUF883 domain-containing protein [Noviherbaspirillum humi]SNS35108.1 Membrane-anchored ribosome-binding protein, inhibits growth in stationary phase, ElaB/YqjD/DUF883 family [Noviherbaspirillum humi]